MKRLLCALGLASVLIAPSPSAIAAGSTSGSAPTASHDRQGLLHVSAATGQVTRSVVEGEIDPEVGVPVTSQTFAPYAGAGVWLLTPGVAMRVRFTLPPGASDGHVELQELGWLDARPGTRFTVQADGARTDFDAAAPRALMTRRVAAGLSSGDHEVLIANNAPDARVGIVSVTVTFRREAPTGADEVRTAKGETAEVEIDLLAPSPGQRFEQGKGIPIEWDTRGFPEGTGIAIHWRTPGSTWQAIDEAHGLPFNHPFGSGTRGAFLWTPGVPVDDVEFGLSYVARGKRDPIRIRVGGENGVKTIREAMELAREGDTVLLAPGTYRETFVIPVSLDLIGADRDRVTISSDAQIAAVTVPEDVAARIAHLTIDCAPALRKRNPAKAIDSRGTLTVEQVRIRSASAGCRTNGGTARLDRIEMDKVTTAIEASGGRIDARGIRASCSHVALRFSAKAQCSIHASRLESAGTGVIVEGAGTSLFLDGATVLGGGATATTDRGVAAYRGAIVRVNGGTISRFGGSGLWSEHQGSRIEATHVRIAENNLYGVVGTNKGTLELRACTIEGNNKGGLTLEGASASSIIDCKVNRNRGWAGTIRSSHGSTITGNRMSGNENDTLWIDKPGRSTRKNNVSG